MKSMKMMTTAEKLRAIRENLEVAAGIAELVARKHADGRNHAPLSLSVLTMLEIETKNVADGLAAMNRETQ